MTNDRPRITLDEAKLRKFVEAGALVPAIDDEQPAGALMLLFDKLADEGIITVPEPYRVSIINDDENDICGMVVQIEVVGTGWPLLSDGWSDIDNYLPSLDDDEGESGDAAIAYNAMHAIIGRADRCIAFAHNVRQAVELVDDVALGNAEYDTLSEHATALLARRVLAR